MPKYGDRRVGSKLRFPGTSTGEQGPLLTQQIVVGPESRLL